MIFKVKVDDFWLDEENLSEGLQRNITSQVIRQIKAGIQEQIDKQLVVKVEEAAQAMIEPYIDEIITKCIESGEITPKREYGKNVEPVQIKEHLERLFKSNTNWSGGEQIKRYAKKFGENMKHQYDAVFANEIVKSMKEQGFLKPEVTQMLLGGDGKK